MMVSGPGGETCKVDLGTFWRARQPVVLPINDQVRVMELFRAVVLRNVDDLFAVVDLRVWELVRRHALYRYCYKR